ncbi:MAG TPA: excinuclease ABC subunit UvrC [Bacilli bacterium]|nr:excinuclease ABC subunit UvrC [Bacilli bacterium]
MFKEKLALLPSKPGCYIHKDKNGNVIYVGKAKNLKKRVSSYFNKIHTGKTKALVDNINDFEYIVTNSEIESFILEINLIKKYSPKYNILLKDDKTYPYIELTNEKYPRVKIIRTKTRKKTKSKLFGPFPNVVSARKTVDLINRIYPLRKCNTLKKDLCLYYHINECLGYCKYNISKEQIDLMIKEITEVLNGNYKEITKKLEEEMFKESENLNYEKALELKKMIEDVKTTISKQIVVSNVKYNFDVFGYYVKDNYLSIETLFIREGIIIGRVHKIFDITDEINDVYLRYITNFYEKYELPKEIIIQDENAISLLSTYLNTKVNCPKKGDIKHILDMAINNAEIYLNENLEIVKKDLKIKKEVLEKLKSLLNLTSLKRIDLFDNSHLFGTYYVGCMVVYEDLEPNKNLYRKYKISLDVKDDLSAMKEVIYRRYYRMLLDKEVYPDLIIIDGGSLQVKVVVEVLNSLGLSIKVIGLKKDDKHKTNIIVDDNLNEISIKQDNHLFLYLTKMQDEVHRFAISFHRDLKSKGSLESVLSNVSGLGDKRRTALLKEYGSLKKIEEASIDELKNIIPEEIAKNLKKYLKEIKDER